MWSMYRSNSSKPRAASTSPSSTDEDGGGGGTSSAAGWIARKQQEQKQQPSHRNEEMDPLLRSTSGTTATSGMDALLVPLNRTTEQDDNPASANANANTTTTSTTTTTMTGGATTSLLSSLFWNPEQQLPQQPTTSATKSSVLNYHSLPPPSPPPLPTPSAPSPTMPAITTSIDMTQTLNRNNTATAAALVQHYQQQQQQWQEQELLQQPEQQQQRPTPLQWAQSTANSLCTKCWKQQQQQQGKAASMRLPSTTNPTAGTSTPWCMCLPTWCGGESVYQRVTKIDRPVQSPQIRDRARFTLMTKTSSTNHHGGDPSQSQLQSHLPKKKTFAAAKAAEMLRRQRDHQRRKRHRRIQGYMFVVSMYLGIGTFSMAILFGPLYVATQPIDAWCPYVTTTESEESQQQQQQPASSRTRQLQTQWKHQQNHGFASSGQAADALSNKFEIDTSAIEDVERGGGAGAGDSRQLLSGDGGSSRFVAMVDEEGNIQYPNPDYDNDPCRRFVRLPVLLGLTLQDCDYCRRMLLSVILGGIIGYERRMADRPAGIRTMGLVSLGSCFYTISSIVAFTSSPMTWDSSRVTAALPSGVGFLGGALIWKGTVFVPESNSEKHQVHGLTTAASVWLSAAIGVGAGGALYMVTIYSTILVLLVLRYGPKMYLQRDNPEFDINDDDDDDEGDIDDGHHHDDADTDEEGADRRGRDGGGDTTMLEERDTADRQVRPDDGNNNNMMMMMMSVDLNDSSDDSADIEAKQAFNDAASYHSLRRSRTPIAAVDDYASTRSCGSVATGVTAAAAAASSYTQRNIESYQRQDEQQAFPPQFADADIAPLSWDNRTTTSMRGSRTNFAGRGGGNVNSRHRTLLQQHPQPSMDVAREESELLHGKNISNEWNRPRSGSLHSSQRSNSYNSLRSLVSTMRMTERTSGGDDSGDGPAAVVLPEYDPDYDFGDDDAMMMMMMMSDAGTGAPSSLPLPSLSYMTGSYMTSPTATEGSTMVGGGVGDPTMSPNRMLLQPHPGTIIRVSDRRNGDMMNSSSLHRRRKKHHRNDHIPTFGS